MERPSPSEVARCRNLQLAMARQVREEPLAEARRIAAVDVHLAGNRGVAAVVVTSYPDLQTIEERLTEVTVTCPYVPGLLSFREAPACLAALGEVDAAPDLLLVDGQGRAHPRRCGLACHIGVTADIPTIGVAKSVLVGRHGPLGPERGAVAPLIDRDEVVGMAVRTRTGVQPVYVSVGHRVTLADAVNWTLRTSTRYRLPEPSRRAHKLASSRAAELRHVENENNQAGR